MTLADIEKRAILETLASNGFNVRKTCESLQIGKTTMYRKLHQWDLRTLIPAKVSEHLRSLSCESSTL